MSCMHDEKCCTFSHLSPGRFKGGGRAGSDFCFTCILSHASFPTGGFVNILLSFVSPFHNIFSVFLSFIFSVLPYLFVCLFIYLFPHFILPLSCMSFFPSSLTSFTSKFYSFHGLFFAFC
jgi:hypothetical protein